MWGAAAAAAGRAACVGRAREAAWGWTQGRVAAVASVMADAWGSDAVSCVGHMQQQQQLPSSPFGAQRASLGWQVGQRQEWRVVRSAWAAAQGHISVVR